MKSFAMLLTILMLLGTAGACSPGEQPSTAGSGTQQSGPSGAIEQAKSVVESLGMDPSCFEGKLRPLPLKDTWTFNAVVLTPTDCANAYPLVVVGETVYWEERSDYSRWQQEVISRGQEIARRTWTDLAACDELSVTVEELGEELQLHCDLTPQCFDDMDAYETYITSEHDHLILLSKKDLVLLDLYSGIDCKSRLP